MKFKLYHPNYVELDSETESKYRCWNDVSSIEDMLKIVFPKDPYMIYHYGPQEEKTICIVSGCRFHIHIADLNNGEAYLMMELPDSGKVVVGFIGFERSEILPSNYVFWNEEKHKWEVG